MVKIKKCLIFFFAAMAVALAGFIFASAFSQQYVELKNANGEVVERYIVVSDDQEFRANEPIQKALDYIRDHSTDNSQMTISVPKGEYTIYSTLRLYSNTVIDFNDSVVHRAESCGVAVRAGRIGEVSTGYDGFTNITVKNLVIDDQKVGRSSLVVFAHAKNVTVENVTLKNTFSVHHQLAFAACNTVKIKNCSFLDMDASEIETVNNCEAVQIDILKEKYFDAYPEYDGTRTANVEITGCTFKNLSRGCGTHSSVAGMYFNNIKINNNYFENINGYAIRTVNYRNSEIKNNVIKNCGSGISISDVTGASLVNSYAPDEYVGELSRGSKMLISSNEITLCNSNFDRAYYYGIDVYGTKVENATDSDGNTYSGDFRISDITIENNNIKSLVSNKAVYAVNINGGVGGGDYPKTDFLVKNNNITFSPDSENPNTVRGLRITNSENILVSDNEIKAANENITAFAFIDYCNKIIFKNNSGIGNAENGINISDSSLCTVSNNILKNTLNNAIYAYSGSEDITIKENEISDSSNVGISARESSNINISQNQITENTGKLDSAVSVGECKNLAVFKNNFGVIKGTTVKFAKVEKGSISENTIQGSGLNAVYVYDKSSNVNITSNIISSCTNYAVAAKDSNDISVKSNTVNDAQNLLVSGVYISSCSQCEVVSNTLGGGSSYSIKLNKVAGAELLSNNISNSAGGAIYIALSSGKINVQSNNISKANGYGFYISQIEGKVRISDNIIKNTKNTALKISKCSPVTVLNNTLSVGDKYGVDISGCETVKVYSNDISGFSSYGVKLSDSKNALFSGNTVKDTFSCAFYVSAQSYGIRLLNNSVSYAKGTAISINSSENIVIQKNNITDKKKATKVAISVSNSGNVFVRSNKIKSVLSNAVKFSSVNFGKISGNNISSCGSYGIYLSASKDTNIYSNTISLAKGGIYAKNSSADYIKKNNIYNSGSAGIYLTGQTVCNYLSGNYIFASLDTAVLLSGQAVCKTVCKNYIDISSKKVNGIAVSGSAIANKICHNEINCKTKTKSKKLSVKCKNGIMISSKALMNPAIVGNSVKNCDLYGIYISKSVKKPAIKSNRIVKASKQTNRR